MAISLKHKFQSTVTEGADSTKVRTSNWSDDHDLLCATAVLLGRTTAGTGVVEELSASAVMTFLGAAPLASPTFTGTPAAPTASAHTDTTQVATTAFAKTEVKRVAQNAQTGTTYGPVAGDAGKMVTLSNAAAITVTVSSATHTAEDRIDFIQKGAGQVTFVGSGVTINSRNGLKLAGQYAGATLWFESSTVAYLFGDLTA
jgi:hypothetical protein